MFLARTFVAFGRSRFPLSPVFPPEPSLPGAFVPCGTRAGFSSSRGPKCNRSGLDLSGVKLLVTSAQSAISSLLMCSGNDLPAFADNSCEVLAGPVFFREEDFLRLIPLRSVFGHLAVRLREMFVAKAIHPPDTITEILAGKTKNVKRPCATEQSREKKHIPNTQDPGSALVACPGSEPYINFFAFREYKTRIMDKDFQKIPSTNKDFRLYFSVIPAQAGIHTPQPCGLQHDVQAIGTCWHIRKPAVSRLWIPACAGMTFIVA